ncbi:GH-E family nuclease [Gordonia sp. CPCC 205333]|uniref:GH-E family nuclease n=1 Tax=Gordonia sp. CPCC 205333 TaxID=3140790 RepID=UPI003AF3E4B9
MQPSPSPSAEPDGKGAKSVPKSAKNETALGGLVLGDAKGRHEGDRWETTLPDGTKIINTIPVGNGDQTVDQEFVGKDGKITSRQRVVSNGEGGYQRWSNETDGRSGYQLQMKPGENVEGISWDPGADPAGAIPRSSYGQTWDGKKSSTVATAADGSQIQVDSAQKPDGTWSHRQQTGDGSVTLMSSGPGGKDTKVTGQIDPKGTGWFTDDSGRRVDTFIDGNRLPVYVTTDPNTGSKTYQFVDPKTNQSKANVVDKNGSFIGHMDFNQDGSVKSGEVFEGKFRTTWENGKVVKTNVGDDSSVEWKKVTLNTDATTTVEMKDGTVLTLNDKGEIAKIEMPPDTRFGLQKAWDGAWESGKNSINGFRSLVGLGPYGTADTWKALGGGIFDGVLSVPQIAYDAFREGDEGYVASKSAGDRIADTTNLLLGVDFRDFAGEDPWGTSGQLTVGILSWIITPTKVVGITSRGVRVAGNSAKSVAARAGILARDAAQSVRVGGKMALGKDVAIKGPQIPKISPKPGEVGVPKVAVPGTGETPKIPVTPKPSDGPKIPATPKPPDGPKIPATAPPKVPSTGTAPTPGGSPRSLPPKGKPGSYGYDAKGNRLPYANPKSRPKYGRFQVIRTWVRSRNAQLADIREGRLALPLPGRNQIWVRILDKDAATAQNVRSITDSFGQQEWYRLVTWKPGMPRNWDMGHLANQEYRVIHDEYMRGMRTPKEFLDWYRDPENYRVEDPARNRSHIDEAP